MEQYEKIDEDTLRIIITSTQAKKDLLGEKAMLEEELEKINEKLDVLGEKT